jgi:hypothetical protein
MTAERFDEPKAVGRQACEGRVPLAVELRVG